MLTSPYFPFVVAGLAFGSALVVMWAVAGHLESRKRSDRIRTKLGASGAGRGNAERAVAAQALDNMVKRLGEKVTPKDGKEHAATSKALIRAGIRHPHATALFWGVKCLLAAGLAGVFLAARMVLFPTLSVPMTAIPAVVLAMSGIYVPEIWLRMRVKKRRTSVLYTLPDALDLLVVCVEAGMGLDQALFRVTEEMRRDGGALTEEFRQLNLELRAGKERKEALKDLAERVDLEDLTSLVTLLIQSDSFGTSVVRTLKVYSDTLRTRRYQRAEEKAAKLPVKLLLPLIFFILPSLFVVIMGPAVISMMGMFANK